MMVNVFTSSPSIEWTKEQYQAVKTTCVLDVPFPHSIESFVYRAEELYDPRDTTFLVEGNKGEVYALVYLLQRAGFLVYYREDDGVAVDRYPQPFIVRREKPSYPCSAYRYTVHVNTVKKRVSLRTPSGKMHTVKIPQALWEECKNPVVFAGNADGGFLLLLADGTIFFFREGPKGLLTLKEQVYFGVKPKNVTLKKASWLFSKVKIVLCGQDDSNGFFTETVIVDISNAYDPELQVEHSKRYN